MTYNSKFKLSLIFQLCFFKYFQKISHLKKICDYWSDPLGKVGLKGLIRKIILMYVQEQCTDIPNNRFKWLQASA